MQVRCLDSITYSEELFAAKTASSDSFFDYTQKVVELFPREPAFSGISVKAAQGHAKKLGITFHGVPLSDTVTRALQNVAPYLNDCKLRSALKSFEDTSSVLSCQTNISMLLHTATKHFGKGTDAAIGACVQVLEYVRLAIVYKDIVKESHVTKEFLIGGRCKACSLLIIMEPKT